MCGIAGIIDQIQSVNKSQIKTMTDKLTHRGPDDEGFYIKDNVGLGHRRLSIIDIQAGAQPISNETGTIWIVFNGEIYNFRSLRKQLLEKGHKFSSDSDTEVIVHLYEDYGDRCVDYLRGMFSFALWDENKQRLYVARDRVGKKPLFYINDKNKFAFASEIKSLRTIDDFEFKLSCDALNDYLTFGYVGAPQSIFDSVKKLMPGHYLVYENGRIETNRYWDMKFSNDGPDDETEAIDKIEKILTEAVDLRMIADVPLGAFLSGGVDSSLIVGIMSKLSSQPVRTFTIGFEEDDYSEIKYADIVAKHLGTEHHLEILKPDILQILDDLVYQYDEPFADSSMIPTYLVSKMARANVTVALSGDGGDEIFGGYNRYTKMEIAQKFDRFPGARFAAGAISRIPGVKPSVKRKLKIISHKNEKRQLILSSVIDENFRHKNYTEQFKRMLIGRSHSEPYKLYQNKPEELNNWLYRDTMTYLPNDILVKVDRASMLTSLETRAPLLDHKLIEFMATIPQSLKTKNYTGKYLLKKLAERYLPKEIIYRPKMGFMIPANHWFKGPLKMVVDNHLLDPVSEISNYIKTEAIKKMLSEHKRNVYDHSPAIFTLFYLELWLRGNKVYA